MGPRFSLFICVYFSINGPKTWFDLFDNLLKVVIWINPYSCLGQAISFKYVVSSTEWYCINMLNSQ